MKDILGRDIAVGMVGAFNPPKYKGITLCKVEKLGKKRVTVSYQDDRWSTPHTSTTSIYPWDLAVLDEKDAVVYFLSCKDPS